MWTYDEKSFLLPFPLTHAKLVRVLSFYECTENKKIRKLNNNKEIICKRKIKFILMKELRKSLLLFHVCRCKHIRPNQGRLLTFAQR